jgi:hypothetical protein
VRLIRLFGILPAVAMVLLATGSASAQTGPPVLSGESLINPDGSGAGAPPQVTADCVPFGISTISFTVSGTAVGPYPGTFTESGTAVIDTTNPFVAGPVTSFTANFTIQSPTGTVTGTKSLISDPLRATGLGTCQAGGLHSFGVATDYHAQIESSEAIYSDQGETNAALNEPALGNPGGAFEEDFSSNLQDLVLVCTPNAQGNQDQDGDNDGC